MGPLVPEALVRVVALRYDEVHEADDGRREGQYVRDRLHDVPRELPPRQPRHGGACGTDVREAVPSTGIMIGTRTCTGTDSG